MPLTITPSLVVPSAQARLARGTAQVAITAGQLVYRGALGVLYLADADHATRHEVAGIAVCSAAAGQPVTYVTRDPALVLGMNHRLGEVYCSSNTAGAIVRYADEAPAGGRVNVVAVADTLTTVNFEITAVDGVRTDPSPADPTAVNPTGGDAFTMTWSQSGTVDGHQVQIQEDGLDWDVDPITVDDSAATTPYNHSMDGIDDGNYRARIRAFVNRSGTTFYSNWVVSGAVSVVN